MTRRIVIVGGETHIGEITQLAGRQLEIAGVLVRADQREQAERLFGAPLYADEETLYRQAAPQVAAIANENDAKAAAILAALEHECDAIVDKPLAKTAGVDPNGTHRSATAGKRGTGWYIFVLVTKGTRSAMFSSNR